MYKSTDINWYHATVTRGRREHLNDHISCVLWFAGLSGAGKSIPAHALEGQLRQARCRTFVLDGDNLRHGLSSDLVCGVNDSRKNIRPIGEVAKLMVDAGVISLTAFISPLQAEREAVRNLVPHGDFIEIYCKASLEVCEARDVKGLYRKARVGEIKNYTGIDSPYEEPIRTELVVETGTLGLNQCLSQVLGLLIERGIVTRRSESLDTVA